MSLPYMQFYPADYFAKTRRLTCLEHGAYTQLLFMMWEANGVLRFDAPHLSDELGLTPEEFERIWAKVGRFFQVKKGRLYNKRITEDLAGKKGISEKRKKASETRWAKKDNENSGMPDANALQTDPILQKPEPEPDKEDADDSASAPRIVIPDGFGDWPAPVHTVSELLAKTGIPAADWQLHTVSELLAWRGNGFSFNLDVVPAIRDVMARKRDGPPRSWSYFTPSIAQARANRTKQISIPEPQNDQHHPARQTAGQRNQDSTIRAFQRVFGDAADGASQPESAA